MEPEFESTETSEERPKKKRCRPTKAESEAKRLKMEAEAALRGPVPEEMLGNAPGIRFVTQRYLLRPGEDESQAIWITLSLPVDTTMDEAERLATFVSSCYYAD